MSLLKPIVAVLGITLLSACANSLQINEAVYEEIGSVTVSVNKSRPAQLFQQEFERMVTLNGKQKPRYRLETELTSNRGTNTMVVTVSYNLYDPETGKFLTSNKFSSSASIGGVTSSFGSDQVAIHARERLSRNLAQKTYNKLLVFFNRRQDPS